MNKKGFIFDLDGVIVDTAKYHYLAWKKLANELGFEFTKEQNELFKGVSRKRCLEILLHDIGKNKAHYSWLFRILSELKINSSKKAKEYLRHELIGYEVLKKIAGIDNDISFYQKELIKQRHYVLEKMDY